MIKNISIEKVNDQVKMLKGKVSKHAGNRQKNFSALTAFIQF